MDAFLPRSCLVLVRLGVWCPCIHVLVGFLAVAVFVVVCVSFERALAAGEYSHFFLVGFCIVFM